MPDSLKILWFGHRDIYHPLAGGAERTILEVSRRLVAKGHVVLWVSCRYRHCNPKSTVDGIEIHRIGGRVTTHLRVPEVIERYHPDVIVDDLAHVVPWFAERLTRTPGTTFFRHLHRRTLYGQVSAPIAGALSWVERQYPWFYRKWPFVTESLQGVTDLKELGLPEARIVRIPPGVDLQRFRPSTKSSSPTMVYFGGFRDYKRPWIPVELYNRLKSEIPGLKLVMVGDGPSRLRVQGMLGTAGSTGVEMVGRVDYERLASLVSSAWLNVHSSVSEGWGYSMLEAASAGTPSVAFAVPGVSETVLNGMNGMTVPDGDINALAVAAVTILRDQSKWVHRSREFAERYTWEDAASKWEAHLKRISYME